MRPRTSAGDQLDPGGASRQSHREKSQRLKKRLAKTSGAGEVHLDEQEQKQIRFERLKPHLKDLNQKLHGAPVRLHNAVKEIILQGTVDGALFEELMDGLDEAMGKKKLPQHLLGVIRPLNDSNLIARLSSLDQIETHLRDPEVLRTLFRGQVGRNLSAAERQSALPDLAEIDRIRKMLKGSLVTRIVYPERYDDRRLQERLGQVNQRLERVIRDFERLTGRSRREPETAAMRKVQKARTNLHDSSDDAQAAAEEARKARETTYFGAPPKAKPEIPQRTPPPPRPKRPPARRRKPTPPQKRPPRGRGGRQSA